MLSLQVKFSADRQTDRWTPVKQYAPDLLMQSDQHFLLFPQCFLPSSKQISISKSHLCCRLHMLSILTRLKFFRLVRS